MNEKILQKKLKKSFVAASLIGLLIVVFSIATVAILNHSLNQMTLEEMKTETEEYSRRIQQQIKKNFQILDKYTKAKILIKNLKKKYLFINYLKN